MRKILVSLAAAAVLLTGACGGSDSPSKDANAPTADAVITAVGTTWKPAELKAKAGETVTWKVEKGLVHDLSGEDGVKHDPANEFTYTHAYAKAGTYSYQCTLHGGMNGTVIVS